MRALLKAVFFALFVTLLTGCINIPWGYNGDGNSSGKNSSSESQTHTTANPG
ncbi:exported hypothetical protein [Syntrophobacter sp. SbD1]|nr:exported hypothetical protein [Syntrophobacter sp. SbD1]